MGYVLEPEVAGGLGDATVMDTSVHPPHVQRLHYQFDDWLGDDLVESFPCYIVTERLRTAIEHSGLSGAAFAPVLVTTSDTFRALYNGPELPVWAWLQVRGTAGSDDFGVVPNARLVVSERAFQLLQQFAIEHCEVALFGA